MCLIAVADMFTSVVANDDSILPNSRKTVYGYWTESDRERPF